MYISIYIYIVFNYIYIIMIIIIIISFTVFCSTLGPTFVVRPYVKTRHS